MLTLSLYLNGERIKQTPSYLKKDYSVSFASRQKRYRRSHTDSNPRLFCVFTPLRDPQSFDLPISDFQCLRIRGTAWDPQTNTEVNVLSVKFNAESLNYCCNTSGRFPPLAVGNNHIAVSFVYWRLGIVRCTITRIVILQSDFDSVLHHQNLRHLVLPVFYEYYADRWKKYTLRSGHVVTDEFGSIMSREQFALVQADTLRELEFCDYRGTKCVGASYEANRMEPVRDEETLKEGSFANFGSIKLHGV